MNPPWKAVASPKLQRHIMMAEVATLFGWPTSSYSLLMFPVLACTCSWLATLSSLHDHPCRRTHTPSTHAPTHTGKCKVDTERPASPNSRPFWREGSTYDWRLSAWVRSIAVERLWSPSSKQTHEFKQSCDATVKSTVVRVIRAPLYLTNDQQKTKYRRRALRTFLRA